VFEYHGWITLARTPAAEDDDAADAQFGSVVIPQIRTWLEPFSYYAADLRTHNGLPMIWLQGHPNHCTGRDVLLIALYRQIGEVAPGSYGILFMFDDGGEMTASPDDSSRTVEDIGSEGLLVVLKRGQVEVRADQFFSPRIPTVEDPWPEP
jgi:hypothetical protein